MNKRDKKLKLREKEWLFLSPKRKMKGNHQTKIYFKSKTEFQKLGNGSRFEVA